MKVALIHDHLAQAGGAEKVLKSLADIYTDAPIYTLLYEEKNALKNYPGRRIDASIIQKLPGGVKHYKWYLPLMPIAVEFFDLREYGLVISDASAFAKGVITSPGTVHVCYCHTPTRYLWDYSHQYINELKYNKFLKKIISVMLNRLRIWDRVAADRVDYFIANSREVQKRIKKYYRRDSVVIYPPVETGKFFISDAPKNYFLIGGRLAPYKRVDLVVEVFRKNGRRLKIFGDGVDFEWLKELSGGAANIEFLGRINDDEKAKLYSGCLAFLNPQEEDFGITAVEAMASGRPVIAFARGGALETVVEGKTGVFFREQTPEALERAIFEFDSKNWNPAEIREHALAFSEERFKNEIKQFVEEKMREAKN